MGYPFGKKAYKVMDLETHKFHVSRDVVFHEEVFPFATEKQHMSLFQPPSQPITGEEELSHTHDQAEEIPHQVIQFASSRPAREHGGPTICKITSVQHQRT